MRTPGMCAASALMFLLAPDKAGVYVAPLALAPFSVGERHRYDFVITHRLLR